MKTNSTSEKGLTIGRLAQSAGVGVETIRYYQRRGLLPTPANQTGFRHYPIELINRIQFIKRAQELGFSLNEITELLHLDDTKDRTCIRQVASRRLEEVEYKLADLARIQAVLQTLITTCQKTGAEKPCPIINSLFKDER